MRAILVLFVLAASPAYAEGPFVVRAGIGLSADRGSRLAGTPAETRFGPGIHADIAYRVMDQLAAGVHVALVRTGEKDLYSGGGDPVTDYWRWSEVYTSVQIGIGAQWSIDRFWLASWVGIDERAVRDISIYDNPALSPTIGGSIQARQLAFGLGAGADLYVAPSGHRVGVYLDIARGHHSEENPVSGDISFSNLYLSAGVAYRYW